MTTVDDGHLAGRLDAYVDGELEPKAMRDVEAHLIVCAACQERVAERRVLSAALREALPVFRAPDALRAGVMERPRRWARPPWVAVAAAAALIIMSWGSGYLWGARSRQSTELRDALVTSHIRSLLPNHLMDVVSSDQHTVKPWFTGQLDFSPTVVDLSAQGFPLLGGRLDYVAGRRVPVLAYGRAKHIINVFQWPAAGGDQSVQEATTRGYHLFWWTRGGTAYSAISDLNVAEMRQFVGLVRDATAQ
jgi:anti-sigma factor RsiW